MELVTVPLELAKEAVTEVAKRNRKNSRGCNSIWKN